MRFVFQAPGKPKYIDQIHSKHNLPPEISKKIK